MKAVIYKITNLKTGMYYVGSTKNYHNRIRTHFKDLSKSKHHNIGMQYDYDLFGEDVFVHEILQEGEFENLLHLLRIETSVIRQGRKSEMYNIERNPLARYKREAAKRKKRPFVKKPKKKKKKSKKLNKLYKPYREVRTKRG